MKLLSKAVLAAALIIASIGTANAGWVAYAASTSAYGWGYSNSKQTAMTRALYECNIRSFAPCYITQVYWE